MKHTNLRNGFNLRLFAIFALAILAATGCASHTFSVTSDPVAADVSYEVTQGGKTVKKSIGKTPLTLPMSQVKTIIGTETAPGQYFPVVIEKKGYETQTIAIPASRFGTTITDIKVKMKATPVDQKEKEEATAKSIIDRLFLAQKFALTQQFERAQAELDRILEDFPNFARAMSMRASIYYAQKNMAESLKWYELALKADPQMDDAVKFSAKIRGGAQGDRQPATDATAPASSATPAAAVKGGGK